MESLRSAAIGANDFVIGVNDLFRPYDATMPRVIRAAALAFLATITATPTLRAQTMDAGPIELKLSGRVQSQFNTTSVDEDEIGDPLAWSTFEMRRVRLSVEATVEDWLTGKLESDFALGDLDLKDAWINFGFDDAFQVRFGQFKKPFSRIELISSTQILPIERGLRIRGLDDLLGSAFEDGRRIFPDFDGRIVPGEEYDLLNELLYLGREMGVMVHGGLGERVGYALGVFNGSGADERDRNDGKSVAGRLTFTPTGQLSIGAGASYREARIDDGLGGEDEVGGVAFELDAEWGAFRRPALHVVAEVAVGDHIGLDETFLAAQGWLAYFHPIGGGRVEGVEPLVRLSFGDPDLGRHGDGGVLLTPGVNVYFFGRNRFMLNWDVFFPAFDEIGTENALRAQAQFYF